MYITAALLWRGFNATRWVLQISFAAIGDDKGEREDMTLGYVQPVSSCMTALIRSMWKLLRARSVGTLCEDP